MTIAPGYGSLLQRGKLWEGEVQLPGAKWRVGAFAPARGVRAGDAKISFFLLQRADTTGPVGASYAWLFSPVLDLFLEDQAFRLDWSTAGADPAGRMTVAFRKQTPELGELKIEGQDIVRLQLFGRELVLLDRPKPVVRVPVGRYSFMQLTVGKPGQPARFLASLPQPVNVTPAAGGLIRAGGPLTNQVTVTRRGRSLRLDYRLVGAYGVAYQFVDRRQPPHFTVSQKGHIVGRGTFEFG